MPTTCPNCGKECASYKGYAVHHSKSDHEGIPLVELVGRGRLVALYWSKDYEEIADELGVGSTTVVNVFDELELPAKTDRNRVEHTHGVSLTRVLYHLHHDAKMSVNKMSTALDVSRKTLDRWFADAGVYKRGQSEAEALKWERMSAEEREQQVAAAHKKTRNLAEAGNHPFQRLWDENPEEMRERAREVAALGAPAREENGMAGITGQDHPGWRGGKSIYDAVKKQLRPSFQRVKDEYRDDVCGQCGRTAEETGRTLDVHHIIPLLCGGTNEPWNVMTLCTSCHHKAEWHTRDLIDPVLTE